MAASDQPTNTGRKPRRRGLSEETDTPFSGQVTEARGAAAVTPTGPARLGDDA